MTLPSSVRDRWLALGDPPPGLVVAVSGGSDSVALARVLLAVRPNPTIPIVLAHLNHQLRGEHSDADETFVRQLHQTLTTDNVRLVTHRLDIAALARQEKENLEAVARRERYRWLAEVARSQRLAHIATGHTASDQAETVLFRLLRGTGLEGLRGIAAQREIEPGIVVVRPLLDVTRDEVLNYLHSIGQDARHDSSNDDRRFTRNRIRHELLPLLGRDYNPRVAEALTRLAEQAEELFAEEESAARAILERAELPRAGSRVILDVDALRPSSRLTRAVLRLVWRREDWPMGEMGYDDWNRVADLVRSEKGAHDLPGGIHARRQGRVLQLGPTPQKG